jgi:hypothetical protein
MIFDGKISRLTLSSVGYSPERVCTITRIRVSSFADLRNNRVTEAKLITQIGDAIVIGFDVWSESTKVLDEAFLTAYLVTQSDAIAEQMVCLAIERVDASQLYGRVLLAKTLSLCVALSTNAAEADSVGSKNWSLPEQLQAVMELQRALRYCFVARVLLDFSLRDCVDVLQMDAVTITKSLIEATQRLCRRSERCNGACRLLPSGQLLRAAHNEMYETHGPAILAATCSSASLSGRGGINN